MVGVKEKSFVIGGIPEAVARGLDRTTFDVCAHLMQGMSVTEYDAVYALPLTEKLYMEQEVFASFTSTMFEKSTIRASGSKGKAWPRIGQCQDFLPDGRKLDKYGMIVGFGAHMPLFLICRSPTKTKEEYEGGEGGRASGSSWQGDLWKARKQSSTTTKLRRTC